ncbi:MAG: G5 domain-containing protein [Veillonella sp.]
MAQGEEEVVQVGQPGTERVETLYNGTAIRTNELSKSVMTNMVPTVKKVREVTTSRNVSGRIRSSLWKHLLT